MEYSPLFLLFFYGGRYHSPHLALNSSLPGALGMLGIALGIRNIQSQLPDIVYALLSGLNSATVGLIALAGVQLSERAIINQMTRFIICTTACVGLLYSGISRDYRI
jgi:chromate transport protein ChrA